MPRNAPARPKQPCDQPATPTLPTVDHRTAAGENRKARTKACIVRAAAVVFAEQGADGPVIDDFIRAAGVARGTFYNHFATTSELLKATIHALTAELSLTIFATLDRIADPIERSATGMRLYLDWITSDQARCAFFGKIPDVSETAKADARRRLRLGKASGHFVFATLDAACDLSFGALSETIRRIAKTPGAPGTPARCDEVVSMVLGALGVPSERIDAVMALPLPPLKVGSGPRDVRQKEGR